MFFKGLEIAAVAFLCLVSLDTVMIVAAAPVNRNITARHFKAGFKNVAYYADWKVDSFQPQEMPVENLTHILHSFSLPTIDGSINLQNTHSNLERPMSDGAHGIIESLFLLKEKHRNLKTLLSIGGYGEPTSAAFTALAASSTARAHFVESAIAKIKEYGFDGIDIDWEYPSSLADGVNFVKLLAELRAAMDAYSSRSANNYHFEITAAVSGAAWGYRNLDFSGMDKYLDAWHLMTYDFKGGWETGADATAGHHANLYHSKTPGASALAADDSVESYLQHHIPSKKIVLGLPLYAHAYFGTDGLGMPYSRTEAEGFPYKEMATSGPEYIYDSEAGAAYTYNPETKTLMSFDSPESVKAKMMFLKEMKLGGAMWWEISNDKIGDDSLVSTVANELAGGWEVKENLLCYPESTITKIREVGC